MDTVMLKGKETGLMALGIVVGILVASELVRMILWAEIRRKKMLRSRRTPRGPGEEESGLIKYSLFGSVKKTNSRYNKKERANTPGGTQGKRKRIEVFDMLEQVRKEAHAAAQQICEAPNSAGQILVVAVPPVR